MKTKITTFIFSLFASMSLIGQNCVEQVTLSTSAWGGELELNPYIFVDGEDANDTYTVTPATIDCGNIGTTSILVEGPDGFSCTSTLIYEDNIPPVVVADQNIVLTLSPDGTAFLLAQSVDDGSYDNCTDITISITPNTFTCDDVGEVLVTLRAEDEYGNWNEAWTNVSVIETIAPTVLANDYLNVSFDSNGEAVLSFDMVEQGTGSFDNCGTVIKSLSQTNFDCSDAGEQNVILTVVDESGNQASEIIIVNFEDKLPPVPVVVNLSNAILSAGPGDLTPSVKLYAEDFDIGSYDNCGIEEMTINKDVFTCDDIGENEVVFTVYDAAGNSNSALVALTIIDNSTTTTSLACADEVTYYTFTDLPTIPSPYDFLVGGPYGCDFVFSLEIRDVDGNPIPNNQLTEAYLGQSLSYKVIDFNTGNSCWGSIVISDEDSDCEFSGVDDINWPLELIELDLLNVEAEEVTPEYIANQPDYTFADAYPTIDADSCDLIGIAYSDIVIPSGNFSYKILREFTVIDWINFDDPNVGVYTFDQIINNNNYPAWYICDTLPRSAPLGDCDSGHTLDDHVEWPNDISIADHRITPSELINFSGIVLDDSEPQFSGEDAEFYNYSYDDKVGDLTGESIIIERIWTVKHLDIPNIDFNYTQEIEVVFADFSNLVAVNTHSNRAVPEVDLGNNIMTDQFGKALVGDNLTVAPVFSTDPLNGLDIVDVYMMREHVLGISQLSPYQIAAADINGEDGVTTLDIVLLQRILLGLTTDTDAWSFLDITDSNTGLETLKGHYVAIKSGDVNDSALLPGETAATLDGANLYYEDQLINVGENYDIPFYSEAMINATGIELRMNYEPSLLKITDVTSDLFNDGVVWSVNEEEKFITILITDVEESHYLDGTEELFHISAEALNNSVLQQGLLFSETYRSFFIDTNLEKYRINGAVDNGMVIGTNDQEFAAGINVYPNPAVDFITVDLSKTNILDEYSISLFDTDGRQISTQRNSQTIKTSTIQTGSYLLYLSSGDSYYSQIIQVYR